MSHPRGIAKTLQLTYTQALILAALLLLATLFLWQPTSPTQTATAIAAAKAQIPTNPSILNSPRLTPTSTITSTSTQTPLPCGLAWNVIDSISPGSSTNYLFSVAPVSANDVWVVGHYCVSNPCYTLIEHWDGTQSSIVSSPNPGTATNLLNDVAAISANDVWAVGYYRTSGPERTLVEHWNGNQWSVIPSPNVGITITSMLRRLEVVSTNDIWAVGVYYDSYENPLIEHWDGNQWSIVPNSSPISTNLYSISAVSGNDVWAVGASSVTGHDRTFVQHWDGSQWSVVPSPNGGTLDRNNNLLEGVAAVSTNDVWAVGYYTSDTNGVQTLVLHWDGVEWAIVPSPNATTHGNYLYSVDANPTYGANDVWAVGYDLTGTRGETLVLHWDGIQWSIVPSTSSAAYHNQLNKVTTLSSQDVWAVGYVRRCFSGCPWETLIEHYADPCATPSPSPTITPTPTATETVMVVSHVVWQGRPGQPNPLQQLPITLTLKSGDNEINYPAQTTDMSGYFTVTAPSDVGSYRWRVKSPMYLANSGTVGLMGAPTTQQEMGLMRAGDANNDNVISALDFNILKGTFGKSVGDPGYDDRSDFTGDQAVNITDFNLLKGNFGQGGAPPILPTGLPVRQCSPAQEPAYLTVLLFV